MSGTSKASGCYDAGIITSFISLTSKNLLNSFISDSASVTLALNSDRHPILMSNNVNTLIPGSFRHFNKPSLFFYLICTPIFKIKAAVRNFIYTTALKF